MTKIALVRSTSFALVFLAAPLFAASSAIAACPAPSGFVNLEFSPTYQPHLARIKFTPAVAQKVASKLAAPVNPSLSSATTIAILDGYSDNRHIDLCGNQTVAVLYSGAYTKYSVHGTHVSGIVGANRNNAGLVGVDPFARLLNIPVFDDYGWRPTDLGNAALNYAKASGARVANMSYSSTQVGAVFMPSELNMLRNHNSTTPGQGLVIARAAGNDGALILNQGYVGNASVDLNNLLIVGSVNAANTISSFSNRPGNACMTAASCVAAPANYVKNFFLVAPGENIWSDAPNQSIASLSGTSMAAPQVAGAAGLVIQYALAGNTKLTPGQVTNILKKSATKLGTSAAGTPDAIYGWGLLNVDAAINSPVGGASVTTQSTVSASGKVALGQSGISTAKGSMIKSALEQGLSGLVVFDGFDRPFQLVGPKTTEEKTSDTRRSVSLITSLASLQRTLLLADDKNTYSLVTSGDDAGLGVNVFSITSTGFSADFGRGAAASYFASAPLPEDVSSYSRDLAGLFLTASGDAGKALQDETIFAAADVNAAPGLVLSSVLMKTAPYKRASLGDDNETQEISFNRSGRRDDTALIRTGVRYDLGSKTSLGASYGVLMEQDTAMGVYSSGAYSLGDRAVTHIFGASVKRKTGERSAIQAFADRTTTSTTQSRDSLFSAIDNWRGSKIGVAYETTEMFSENDSVRLVAARPCQVDKGTLGLHVPVGRELDGTVNYSGRTVGVGSDASPLDLSVQYRGSNAFINYAFETQLSDRDLGANDGLGVTALGAIQFDF